MLGRNSSEPALFQMVNLEALIPANHRLRRIDAVLDLSFVEQAVAACYSAGRGRPGIDPELALRMMLLGVLYDLSDRELCDEIVMHAGFRWFCRLNFHDPVPDHSTLSRLRNERWAESGLWDRLRDEVLRQCAEAGLISGRHLSLDGTQMEADASMKSLRRTGPEAVPEHEPEAPQEGSRRVREPQPRGAWRGHGQKFSNDTHRSITDPDARIYRKGNSQDARMRYLVHDLIDTRSRVILRRRASHATNFAERELGLVLLDEVLNSDLLARPPEILTADAGYGTTGFVEAIFDRGLVPHIPLQCGAEMEPLPSWQRRPFTLQEASARKERLRQVTARNRAREQYRTRSYRISRLLRVRSEHIFAEGKQAHGLRRTRRRGLATQCPHMELSAAVQNLKRLVSFLGRGGRRKAAAAALRSGLQPTAGGRTSRDQRSDSCRTRRAPSAGWRRISRIRKARSSTAF
jgi:transposase